MESVFFTNPVLLIFGVIALFCTVASYFIPRAALSATASVAGAAIVVFCVTYALLLGATLTEALVYVLVFAALSALTFIPSKKGNGGEDKNSKPGGEKKPGEDPEPKEGEEQ